MEVKEVLEYAKETCGDIIFKTHYLYPFTTENIDGYLDLFDLKDKSLLTVGSSGDQVINALVMGCEDVTLYDKVFESKYYYYLKCAGILTLTREEYLKFFAGYEEIDRCYTKNHEFFNKEIFDKLKPALKYLNSDAYYYFDELFNLFDNKQIREGLFTADEDRPKALRVFNRYLHTESLYKKARKKIEKIEPVFIQGDILDLDPDRKYDNIWFSNIANYLGLRKVPLMAARAYNALNENGKVLLCYLYATQATSKYERGWTDVYNLKRLYKKVEAYEYELKSFEGVYPISSRYYSEGEEKDSILILTKKKQ